MRQLIVVLHRVGHAFVQGSFQVGCHGGQALHSSHKSCEADTVKTRTNRRAPGLFGPTPEDP